MVWRENRRWRRLDFILDNVNDAGPEKYGKIRHVREAEHQVGRFLNMKKIVNEIEANNYQGAFVEFGTFQGLGLALLDKCVTTTGVTRFIGIDSFEGLPESSTIWSKGDFEDTDIEQVNKDLSHYLKNCLSVELIKGWFSEPAVGESLGKKCEQISLVHFDADLGSSTLEALAIIEPWLRVRKEPMFFLFDDWGCHPDEVPDAFGQWLLGAKAQFNLEVEKLYSTDMTRYFRVTFPAHI